MFFFFKQKTAYEMRISDWSSDVCSSDLHIIAGDAFEHIAAIAVDVHLDVTLADRAELALQLFRRDAAARPVILADTVEHGDDIVAHRNGADASGRVAIAVEYRCRCERLQLPVGGHGQRARARCRN